MKYSVVIPMKNEEENVRELIEELEPVMQSLGEPWELLIIDDGSTDETKSILLELKKTRPHIKIIAFEGNYGQSSGFDAGFKIAQGQWIITLDGDRQNDPKDITKMIPLTQDADLVCGQRIQRRDPWHKRITSSIANAIRSRLCHDGIHDTGCSLKIYRTSSLREIKLFEGMHRFLPALFQIEGFKVVEVPVNHRERVRGVSKYNIFNRSLNTVVDMFAVMWMRKRHLRYRDKKKPEVL